MYRSIYQTPPRGHPKLCVPSTCRKGFLSGLFAHFILIFCLVFSSVGEESGAVLEPEVSLRHVLMVHVDVRDRPKVGRPGGAVRRRVFRPQLEALLEADDETRSDFETG